MLKIEHLSKKYNTKQALKNIDLEIPQGQIIGLFGENGAGKTTLMKCILGYLNCKGRVTLTPEPTAENPNPVAEPITHKNIARLSFATCEHSFFPGLTAKGHEEFYREHFPTFREKRFKGLMEFFELPMNKKISSFSTGQKNQFEVVMALSQGADYILMDEPFAGNDVFNRDDFYRVLLGILEPEETVILSTHLLEEVENFIGRAILLHRGEIIGDCDMEELEEKGMSLMDYVRATYNYRKDRVGKAIADITEEE